VRGYCLERTYAATRKGWTVGWEGHCVRHDTEEGWKLRSTGRARDRLNYAQDTLCSG